MTTTLLNVLAGILVLHSFFMFFATKDLIEHPLFNHQKKMIYFLFILLVPFYGPFRAQKAMNSQRTKISESGGDPYTDADPGSNGSCSGDGGGC